MQETAISGTGAESPIASNLLHGLGASVVRLDHIAIAVPDLSRAINWYTTQCGFRLLERRTTRGEHTGMISAVVAAGAAVIVLVQGTEPGSQVSRFVAARGSGVQHVALEVTGLDSLVGQQLAAAGVASDTSIIEGTGIRQVFLRRDDASGVRIELIERNGGEFSDDSVKRIFIELESKGLY